MLRECGVREGRIGEREREGEVRERERGRSERGVRVE